MTFRDTMAILERVAQNLPKNGPDAKALETAAMAFVFAHRDGGGEFRAFLETCDQELTAEQIAKFGQLPSVVSDQTREPAPKEGPTMGSAP